VGELALKSPLAVVTGASSGIGAELALQLAVSGTRVLAIARRGALLDELSAKAKAANGAELTPMALDLTADGAPAQIAARAEALGGAAWLVNDAGLNSFGAFREANAETTGRMIRLNCEALVAVTAALLPKMLERRHGVVLNVASVAGFVPTPFMAVYGATKAFVLSYSEALRAELLGSGVSVTALCPGPVSTGIYALSAPGVTRKAVFNEVTAEDCARAALSGARNGTAIVVPGLFNKLNLLSAKLAPRALVRWLLRAQGLSYLGYPRTAFKP
jgi:short-subunit dehydrogenase